MKLYILQGSYDYEGSWVEGVFSNPEKAREFVMKKPRSDSCRMRKQGGDWEPAWRYADGYELFEMELDVADPMLGNSDQDQYRKSLEKF